MNSFRTSLTLLVLLNVIFVHITGAVGLEWMLPLYLLTLIAPFTKSLRDSKVWRGLWNVGVLGIFGMMVYDAIETKVLYLLEDGLILAAACQVHLLNVLQKRQRPDLVFFNSFLIALVTSYFSQDLVFSATFVVWAVLFVMNLQIGVAITTEGELRPQMAPAVLRNGAKHALVALGVTGLVFLFWPRDFHREGLVREQMWQQQGRSIVDFSDQVTLGRSGQTTLSNRVVMKVHLLEGRPEDVPAHWRGTTLTSFDRHGWRVRGWQIDSRLDPRWRRQGRSWGRGGGERTTRVRVDYHKPRVEILFAPLESQTLAVLPPGDGSVSVPRGDGTFEHAQDNHFVAEGEPIAWELGLRPLEPLPEPRELTINQRRRLLDQHPKAVPEAEARALLADALIALPRDASQQQMVEQLRRHLAESREYLLPGQQGAAGSLAEFLRGGAGGHCEYFATALTVMLRLEGIPCRLVTGYLAQEWDAEERMLIVRDKHAHAWVEVWDPSCGWYTVDSTPASDLDDEAGQSWYEELMAKSGKLWESVTQFDDEDRAAVFAWFANLPGNVLRSIRRDPLGASGLAFAAGLLLWLLHRLRIRGQPAAVRLYQRCVRRTGMQRRDGETPRQLLERAEAEGLKEGALARLAAATQAHERMRYQPRPQ